MYRILGELNLCSNINNFGRKCKMYKSFWGIMNFFIIFLKIFEFKDIGIK